MPSLEAPTMQMPESGYPRIHTRAERAHDLVESTKSFGAKLRIPIQPIPEESTPQARVDGVSTTLASQTVCAPNKEGEVVSPSRKLHASHFSRAMTSDALVRGATLRAQTSASRSSSTAKGRPATAG